VTKYAIEVFEDGDTELEVINYEPQPWDMRLMFTNLHDLKAELLSYGAWTPEQLDEAIKGMLLDGKIII
jgi:hypothetical protein